VGSVDAKAQKNIYLIFAPSAPIGKNECAAQDKRLNIKINVGGA